MIETAGLAQASRYTRFAVPLNSIAFSCGASSRETLRWTRGERSEKGCPKSITVTTGPPSGFILSSANKWRISLP
jgi:hypothetical protein